MNHKALVLFSGGQDSATCLVWALQQHAQVETIGFDYGQRHAVELQCRTRFLAELRANFPAMAARLGNDHVVDLGLVKALGATAMTHDIAIRTQADGLPNTFVPGRNLLFFTTAAAVAYRRGLQVLVGGMCETDYSGYPDCRDNTLKALQVALSLGLAAPLVIQTPLMWLDKAATWRLAQDLGGRPLLDLVIDHTHSCYLGDRSRRHAWGHGCGSCPACVLRSTGFAQFTAGADAGTGAGAVGVDAAPGPSSD